MKVEGLRRIRMLRGMSQEDLENRSEVSQDTISALETGRREPRPSTLRKLAKALDVEIADLFMGPELPKGSAPDPLERLRALPPESVRRLLRGYGNQWTSGTILEARAVADRLGVSREELRDLLVQVDPLEARRLLVGEDEDEATIMYMDILGESGISDAEKWRRLSVFRDVA